MSAHEAKEDNSLPVRWGLQTQWTRAWSLINLDLKNPVLLIHQFVEWYSEPLLYYLNGNYFCYKCYTWNSSEILKVWMQISQTFLSVIKVKYTIYEKLKKKSWRILHSFHTCNWRIKDPAQNVHTKIIKMLSFLIGWSCSSSM